LLWRGGDETWREALNNLQGLDRAHEYANKVHRSSRSGGSMRVGTGRYSRQVVWHWAGPDPGRVAHLHNSRQWLLFALGWG
jgi:hypothetical protein